MSEQNTLRQPLSPIPPPAHRWFFGPSLISSVAFLSAVAYSIVVVIVEPDLGWGAVVLGSVVFITPIIAFIFSWPILTGAKVQASYNFRLRALMAFVIVFFALLSVYEPFQYHQNRNRINKANDAFEKQMEIGQQITIIADCSKVTGTALAWSHCVNRLLYTQADYEECVRQAPKVQRAPRQASNYNVALTYCATDFARASKDSAKCEVLATENDRSYCRTYYTSLRIQ
ncbi:MAG: hypothetical protein AAB619_01980 [Patescibacteria group bacterium]